MGQALFGVAGALDRAGRVRPPRSTPRRRALVTAANQATFPFVPAAIGPLALILTVAAVQTVGRPIVLRSFGNRGLSCRGTKSSNPAPSRRESANFQFLDGAAAALRRPRQGAVASAPAVRFRRSAGQRCRAFPDRGIAAGGAVREWQLRGCNHWRARAAPNDVSFCTAVGTADLASR
jgi:hypothetical protein